MKIIYKAKLGKLARKTGGASSAMSTILAGEITRRTGGASRWT